MWTQANPAENDNTNNNNNNGNDKNNNMQEKVHKFDDNISVPSAFCSYHNAMDLDSMVADIDGPPLSISGDTGFANAVNGVGDYNLNIPSPKIDLQLPVYSDVENSIPNPFNQGILYICLNHTHLQ